MKPQLRAIMAVLLAGALAACATVTPRVPYAAAEMEAAQPLPGEAVRFWTRGDDAAHALWSATFLEQRRAAGLRAPGTLLALSGGSDKGAFGAGLLNGWTRRGDRPSFDIVTGVSTGALIAPFAFLGPEEDATLTAIYTGISGRDVYRQRVVRGVLGGESLLDSAPLAGLIARYATPALIDRIAAEHRRGRRLLVMTANLDAQRGVIWDMGAIASSASPRRVALFRQVLLASASIPAAFPPVRIDVTANGRSFEEMHVDGGTVAGFFVLPRSLMVAPPPDAPSDGGIYVIYNGRFRPEFEVVSPRTFSIAARALYTLLAEVDRTNVEALRTYAQNRSIDFVMCAVEEETPDEAPPLFDTAFMRGLYASGVAEAGSTTGCLGAPARP